MYSSYCLLYLQNSKRRFQNCALRYNFLHAALRKKVPDINPYIVNWVIDFLEDRQQRVCVDKVMAPFLPVNNLVPRAFPFFKGKALGTRLACQSRCAPRHCSGACTYKSHLLE